MAQGLCHSLSPGREGEEYERQESPVGQYCVGGMCQRIRLWTTWRGGRKGSRRKSYSKEAEQCNAGLGKGEWGRLRQGQDRDHVPVKKKPTEPVRVGEYEVQFNQHARNLDRPQNDAQRAPLREDEEGPQGNSLHSTPDGTTRNVPGRLQEGARGVCTNKRRRYTGPSCGGTTGKARE